MSTTVTHRRWGPIERLLVLVALGVGTVIALRAPGLGDYPTDAGPALSAVEHGSIGSFFSHQPAMGPVSLYMRAPFVILGGMLHDSPIGLYRLGDLPCVLSVSLVAAWMARAAGLRGTGRLVQVAIIAVCLGNPLTSSALRLGHPEELLTASLAIGSLLAACERRVVLTAVLAGLAVASKQWALLVVVPALLVLEREQIRAAMLMLAVAAGSTLPMVIGNFGAFRHALSYISTAQPVATIFNWLYPFSGTGTVRISYVFSQARATAPHTVPGVVSVISHPLIIGVGVAVPLLVWLRQGRPLPAQEMLLATALVFVLRCALDPGIGALLPVSSAAHAGGARCDRRSEAPSGRTGRSRRCVHGARPLSSLPRRSAGKPDLRRGDRGRVGRARARAPLQRTGRPRRATAPDRLAGTGGPRADRGSIVAPGQRRCGS